jgi:hypothetical protein
MEMMIKRFFFIVVLFFLPTMLGGFVLHAQNTDLRGRLGAEISYAQTDPWGFAVGFEQRFRVNLTMFDRTILEPDVHYNFGNKIRAGISLRAMYDQSKRGSYRIRYGAAAIAGTGYGTMISTSG